MARFSLSSVMIAVAFCLALHWQASIVNSTPLKDGVKIKGESTDIKFSAVSVDKSKIDNSKEASKVVGNAAVRHISGIEQKENENAKPHGDAFSSKFDSGTFWAILGPVAGGAILLAIVAMAIATKSTATNAGQPSASDSFNVNAVPDLHVDIEKFTSYNGPLSFSETISLPSQTDGSVSQGEHSMKDDDLTGPSGGSGSKQSSISKKASKPHGESISCEDLQELQLTS